MKEINLSKESFKKINNVGDLKKWLRNISKWGVSNETPVLMFSDVEGNEVNKILTLEYFEDGIILRPYHS